MGLCFLLTVSIFLPLHCKIIGLTTLSRVWQHVKLSDVSLGTRPRYSLVVGEDVKKPKQPNKQILMNSLLCACTIALLQFRRFHFF